jgi:hypothetical protein
LTLTLSDAKDMRHRALGLAHLEEWDNWTTRPVLCLPLCPPLNNLYPTRGKHRVKSDKYLAWEEEAWAWYHAQGYSALPPEETGLRWYLDLVVFMPNWSSGDLDNRNKATIDFLCAHRGLQDKYLMRLREVRVTDASRLAGVVLAYGRWG